MECATVQSNYQPEHCDRHIIDTHQAGTSRQKQVFRPLTPQKMNTQRHPDNLRVPEGEFVSCTKNRQDYPERWAVRPEQPRQRRDNLVSVGGDFQGITSSKEAYQGHQQTSRTEVKKHLDNLTSEGTMTFESSYKSEFTEKTARPEEEEPRQTWTKQDREMFLETTNTEKYKKPQIREQIPQVIHQGNLRIDEGTYENSITTSQEVYQTFHDQEVRQKQKRYTDNLRIEGSFQGTPKSKEDFKPVKGEKALVKKPKDNLQTEGNFEGKTTYRDNFKPIVSNRPVPIKHPNNLKLEGDFDRPQPLKYSAPERSYVKKQSEDIVTLSSSEQQRHQGAIQRSSAWSSSSIQQQQQQHTFLEKNTRKDNLSVGEGAFHGQSEARAYGNFYTSTGKTERVTPTRRANISNIILGNHTASSSHAASSYKK